MLEKIAIFMIFLGPLVFFHELGHFLFARFFGVRVEVFSIGFGPKILKKKWKDTEYALSIIPLGGYVKMYGDDPFNKDSVPESEREFAFTHKGKWARFWIVMGGPLANFLMAFVIFYALLINGEKIPEFKLGNVTKESVLYQTGFRTGDIIAKVNGKDVYNPADLMSEGTTTSVTVKRHGEEVQIPVSYQGTGFFDEIVKYPALFLKPVVINEKGERFALSTNKEEANLKISLEEIASLENPGQLYLIKLPAGFDLDAMDMAKGSEVTELNVKFEDSKSLLTSLMDAGYRTLDLEVKSVNMNSPADKVGIKSGDIFVSLEGQKVYSFEQLRSLLQETTKTPVEVEVFKNGELKKFSITPDISQNEGKTVKLMGVYSQIEMIRGNLIQTKSKGVFASIPLAVERTIDSIKKTIDGFVKLITNQVSLKAIGGPLSIGKVAHDSFQMSLSYFFQLMALISVNLGVINLFPIPVLDGGHIMFIGFEILNRGPLSRRKMEFAQKVGLSLLLVLMFGAIFNDITRFF